MPWFKAFTIKPTASEEFIAMIKIEGKEICVVKTLNKIHAFQNRCPHAGGPLCEGWLEEEKIVCPYHHRKFDLETGKGQGMQGDYINIYETRRVNDEVHIKVRRSSNPFRWIGKLFD
jgi:nitrite reductase/ring-hydroxylating ferredoxin subunit